MSRRLALAVCLAAAPALAEPSLTAEAFDALTQGRTMTWSEFGQVYGVEQYLPDRQVRWTVLGDDCITGHWFVRGPEICFLYEDNPTTHCWDITLGGTGMLAHYSSKPSGTAPVEVTETTEPMACFGPRVGV
jgi:hypothetical protein